MYVHPSRRTNSQARQNRHLADTINDKVLPILKKQKGFVDETAFVSD